MNDNIERTRGTFGVVRSRTTPTYKTLIAETIAMSLANIADTLENIYELLNNNDKEEND